MRFVLLLIAALIAVLAGVAVIQLSAPAPGPNGTAAPAAPAGNVSTVDILVARIPIPPGTIITSAMLDKQPWPQPLVLDGFIVSNSTDANIIGKITRASFQAREPLITSKLSEGNNAGFIAAGLPAGMRAITISTDTITGVAGFVFPGDRVDILFTHNIPHELKNGSSDRPAYAEILAANIPVLAINMREVIRDESGSSANAPGPVAPTSMTLQVSELEAEKIRLAEKVGALSVSLRSVIDRDNPAIATPADIASLTRVNKKESVSTSALTIEDDSIRIIRGGDSVEKPQPVQGATK